MTYTNTNGIRNRFLEFSWSILKMNKPAGLLVRLDSNGNPALSPQSNLNGVKISDVNGWAPTSDGLGFSFNNCTGERFEGYVIEDPVVSYTSLAGTTYDSPNDVSLARLLDSKVDAVWIYSD
jgi:hypothetical protein